MQDQQHPVIVDPQGQPARAPKSAACPVCHSKRKGRSAGFGHPTTLCLQCGHDYQQPWEGD